MLMVCFMSPPHQVYLGPIFMVIIGKGILGNTNQSLLWQLKEIICCYEVFVHVFFFNLGGHAKSDFAFLGVEGSLKERRYHRDVVAQKLDNFGVKLIIPLSST